MRRREACWSQAARVSDSIRSSETFLKPRLLSREMWELSLGRVLSLTSTSAGVEGRVLFILFFVCVEGGGGQGKVKGVREIVF